MFRKGILFLLALILIALSVSCISAHNLDNATADEGDEWALAVDFNELSDMVNRSGDGEVICLENDYRTSNSSNQIVISKSITIDGKNHIIEAPDIKRAFLVEADNVCIKNINFINSKSTGLAGGAISWLGNGGTLQNCNFTNNSASSGGGAVCWMGDSGSIANCNFMNNSVVYGPAITLTSGESFDSSAIHFQVVESEGGAVYVGGNNLSIEYCNFYNNTALLYGGAISSDWGNGISISSCKFKMNKASYRGGAIELNSEGASLSGLKFYDNSPNDLFLNSKDYVIENSTFKDESCIESFYDVDYGNVSFGSLDFDDLAGEIERVPEGGTLVLDWDYVYSSGQNKGVVISKPITIDGAGHTLNGNKLSRIFNVTAADVVLKNINFINGNSLGSYGMVYGGGAIYWSGADGCVENCSFVDNCEYSFEYDPYEQEGLAPGEGRSGPVNLRPVGATTAQGGAITWTGENGNVINSTFTHNCVGYANDGGAIFWAGANGNVINSEFYDNDAFRGTAIYWSGANGTITLSKFANRGICDNGIFWMGENGVIKNSLLINPDGRIGVISPYSVDVTADYNFWGDAWDNPDKEYKIAGVTKWIVMSFNHNGELVKKGQKVLIDWNITSLVDKNGGISEYGAINKSGQLEYTAEKDGCLNITCINGNVHVNVDSKDRIVAKDLKCYYKGNAAYKVSVSDFKGKVVGKYVKFTIHGKSYNVKTDRNGIAALKITLKPGTYTVSVAYGADKIKNKITVKTTLITKNMSKKVKKSAKFTVKVLNSKGKVFAKKTVKIKFKGKTYKIKTNRNGIATFNVPKNLKVGKYAIKTMYNGLTNTNMITVSK